MTTFSRRALAVAAAVSLVALLSACATPAGSSPQDSGTAARDGQADIAAAWLDGGRAVGIVTWGSSTCVPFAGEPTLADGVLTVELSDVDGQACTRDYVPRGTLVTLPGVVDAASDLDIVVTGAYTGETALGGAPGLSPSGGEYLPSAGWFGPDDLLLLSWGSSGCVPQLESAEATGPAEVTATFVTPPADQVCTADMAPRITVGSVDDLEADTGVELVLVGDDFDNVRIPVAGSR